MHQGYEQRNYTTTHKKINVKTKALFSGLSVLARMQ